MTLLVEILAYLVSNSICSSGTASANGWSGYIGKMPSAPDRCIGLFEYGGMAPDMTHDKAYDVNPSLQVRIRAENLGSTGYATGIAKADAVLALLHGVSNTTLSSKPYKLILATGSPMYLGTDDKGRPEWTVNFRITKNA
jgi:hypothetical protein